MGVHKIEHIGIFVTALEDSIEFYNRVVGLKLVHQIGDVEDDLRLAFMSFPGQDSVELELIWRKVPEDFPQPGRVHHVAFTVTGIEQEYQRIQTLGLSGLDPAINELPGSSRYFFFNGPDGERLEFFEPTKQEHL